MADKETIDEFDKEFTKVNFDELSDEGKAIYKQFQADYTRKTQAVAESRKTLSEEMDRFKNQLEERAVLMTENKRWAEWYQGLEDQLNADGTVKKPNINSEDDNVPEDQKLIKSLKDTVDSLTTEINALKDGTTKNMDTTKRMFQIQSSLASLKDKYKDAIPFDSTAVMAHAKEIGISDLERAYLDLNREALVKSEATKMAEEIVQQRMEELTAKGIHGHGRQIILKASDKPMSFDQVTEKIVQEKAANGTLDYS